jgi:lipopolysaccharide transport system ATP-binding protein
MTTVISVENLSKVYRLGQIGTGTISYDLQLWWAKIRGKPNPLLRIGETDHGNIVGEDLWALKDISFTVEQGEVLGIIGKNGAGKSTLLKILSRVTAPTTGRVRVKGSIASLLEVGTGFHPELTGRENIYLNGAILGMGRSEIDCKFDEIVDFSEVEKFIDTPVKRYSSGMYVRLAFAVAAHLDPEILVVDEVLAVGDAAFQKKCLGKMGEVAKEGRTVLFVSHNMGSIRRLCERTIVIDKGNIDFDGNTNVVINSYLEQNLEHDSETKMRFHSFNTSGTGIMDTWFENKTGRTSSGFCGDPFSIHLKYCVSKELSIFDWGMTLYDSVGEPVIHFGSIYSRVERTPLPPSGIIICRLSRLPLPAGTYSLNVSMRFDGKYIDHVVGAAFLKVLTGDFYGTGRIPVAAASKVLIDHSWQVLAE